VIVPLLSLPACIGGETTPTAPTVASNAKISWIRPDLKTNLLVYVDGGGVVVIYDYRSGARVGQLTLQGYSHAICSDKAGNVWVSSGAYNAEDMLEFAPGSTIPTAELPTLSAEACAVDPKNGDLAVVTDGDASRKNNLEVYKGAQGTPKTYSDSNIEVWEFCGYDDRDELLVQGYTNTTENRYARFAELEPGRQKLRTINITTDYADGSGIQWDGHRFVIGFWDLPAVYQYKIRSSDGYAEQMGETKIAVDQNYWLQTFAVHGDTLVAASTDDGEPSGQEIAGYPYPAGSPEKHRIDLNGYPYEITLATFTKK
jgi:hypothetical protein